MGTYPSQEYHGAVPRIFSGSIAMVEGLISRLLLVISDNSSYTMLYPGINNLKWPQVHPQDWCTSTKKSQHFFLSLSLSLPNFTTCHHTSYRYIQRWFTAHIGWLRTNTLDFFLTKLDIWGFPKTVDIPKKWLVYKRTSINGWFGGTPILGNLHLI